MILPSHRFIFLAFCFFSLNVVVGQNKKQKKLNFNQRAEATAKQQINELKNGVLLVRLKTQQPKIDALKKTGRLIAAQKVADEQAFKNYKIAKAFQSKFDFCPVLFFYSHQSKYILSGQYDSIQFLNSSLQPDTSLKLKSTNFYVAEFGVLQEDTLKKFEGNVYEYGANGIEPRPEYHGNTTRHIEALVVLSKQLIQLRNPFPYYISTTVFILFEKSAYETVKEFNIALHECYKRLNK